MSGQSADADGSTFKKIRRSEFFSVRADSTVWSDIKQCKECGTFGCVDCIITEGSESCEDNDDNDDECDDDDVEISQYHDCEFMDDEGEGVGVEPSIAFMPSTGSSSGTSSSTSSVGGGSTPASDNKNGRRQKVIGEKLSHEKSLGLKIETMRSSWESLENTDEEATGHLPICYDCDDFAAIRCNDCARGGIFLCSSCDARKHSSHVIHNRDDLCLETGGFSPSKHLECVWSLRHCPHCHRAHPTPSSPEGQGIGSGCDATNVPHPFRIMYHSTHLGRVRVLVVPRRCVHCDEIFGTEAAEFDCSPCATKSDWFGNELLAFYARLNEATGFSISWQSMWEALSANGVARKEDAFTSKTALNFTEAMKVFSAQRCEKRRLLNLEEYLSDVASDSSCPFAVKRSLALLGTCAACGMCPLSSVHDGSHGIRSLHSSGRTFCLPLSSRPIFNNETVDTNLGRLRNKIFSGKFYEFRQQRRAEVEKELKRSNGAIPKDNSCSKDFKALAPLDDISKLYDMTMAFLSSCSHFYASESGGLRVHTPGERYQNFHYQMAERLHNSGQRTLFGVFKQLHEVLEPCAAFFYYDLCCKVQRHLQLTDPELYELTTTLLGKLHGTLHFIASLRFVLLQCATLCITEQVHNCRLLNSAIYRKFTANDFGENIETIWAFLQGLGPLVLHMSDNNLVDFVTQAVIYLNDQSDERIPDLLADRASSCLMRILASRQKLANLVQDVKYRHSIDVNEEMILAWVKDFGMSGSPEVLSLRASICGAAEELKKASALRDAQDVYAEFDDESAAAQLTKLDGAVRKASKSLKDLMSRLPSNERDSYKPENDVEGISEWRVFRRRQLERVLKEKEAQLAHYEEKEKRGNAHDTVYKKEKIKIRKLKDQTANAIKHAKMQLERNRLATLGSEDLADGEPAVVTISTAAKYEIVDTYMVLCRAAEAGGFQIRHDLETYITTHEQRAEALEFAAMFIRKTKGTTRIGLGSAAQLRIAARRHSTLAYNAQRQLKLLPDLPAPAFHGCFLAAPWIHEVVLRCAREQGEFQELRERKHAQLQAQRNVDFYSMQCAAKNNDTSRDGVLIEYKYRFFRHSSCFLSIDLFLTYRLRYKITAN